MTSFQPDSSAITFAQDESFAARYNPHSGSRFSSTDFMRSAAGASGERLATWRTPHKVLYVMQHEDADTTDHGRYAMEFAGALVRGDFEAAAGMLEDRLRSRNPPEQLRKDFEDMVGWYSHPDAERRELGYRDDPPRLGRGYLIAPGDLDDEAGWVYCSIEGHEWSEAAIVLVTTHGRGYAIRQIDWGRP